MTQANIPRAIFASAFAGEDHEYTVNGCLEDIGDCSSCRHLESLGALQLDAYNSWNHRRTE
jgi:hypothetical protein